MTMRRLRNYFGTLKGDFEIRGFISLSSAYEIVEIAINNYNAMRLHASLEYRPATRLTPHLAHSRIGPIILKWYRTKKSVLEMSSIRIITRKQAN